MNPRAALTTYSLSRGAPSASLGTSPKCPRIIHAILFSLIPRLSSYASIFSVVHAHLQGKQKEVHSILNFPSGEGGIRTHAPSRTNGFQDRLVMTTSISLQSALSNVLLYSIRYLRFCQALFKTFFTFFTSFSDHPKKLLPQSYPPVLSP